MTLQEWAELPEDDEGELVDGKLVPDEEVTFGHEVIVGELAYQLAPIDDRGGTVLLSGLKYAVARRRGRKPDVSVFFRGTRLPGMDDWLCKTPPDIAVEVLSARPDDARRDRIEKVVEYARFGIRWYWLVDPTVRYVQVLELGAQHRYTIVVSVSSGAFRVAGCRGLKFDVDRLWAPLDRLQRHVTK